MKQICAKKGYFLYKAWQLNISTEFGIFERAYLSAHFYLKETILIFWRKFAKKDYFRFKTEKVNITIEFSIFGLAKASTFTLIRQF